MVSRRNTIVLVCAMAGTFAGVFVADNFGYPGIGPAALVYVGAILPMLINNRIENSEADEVSN